MSNAAKRRKPVVLPDGTTLVIGNIDPLLTERRLCTACQRHVCDTAIREPADWIGPPPQAKVRL